MKNIVEDYIKSSNKYHEKGNTKKARHLFRTAQSLYNSILSEEEKSSIVSLYPDVKKNPKEVKDIIFDLANTLYNISFLNREYKRFSVLSKDKEIKEIWGKMRLFSLDDIIGIEITKLEKLLKDKSFPKEQKKEVQFKLNELKVNKKTYDELLEEYLGHKEFQEAHILDYVRKLKYFTGMAEGILRVLKDTDIEPYILEYTKEHGRTSVDRVLKLDVNNWGKDESDFINWFYRKYTEEIKSNPESIDIIYNTFIEEFSELLKLYDDYLDLKSDRLIEQINRKFGLTYGMIITLKQEELNELLNEQKQPTLRRIFFDNVMPVFWGELGYRNIEREFNMLKKTNLEENKEDEVNIERNPFRKRSPRLNPKDFKAGDKVIYKGKTGHIVSIGVGSSAYSEGTAKIDFDGDIRYINLRWLRKELSSNPRVKYRKDGRKFEEVSFKDIYEKQLKETKDERKAIEQALSLWSGGMFDAVEGEKRQTMIDDALKRVKINPHREKYPRIKGKYGMGSIRWERKFRELFEEEKKEHPTFTDKQINQIVLDHMTKEKPSLNPKSVKARFMGYADKIYWKDIPSEDSSEEGEGSFYPIPVTLKSNEYYYKTQLVYWYGNEKREAQKFLNELVENYSLFLKEKREHSSLSDEQIWQIVKDHMKFGKTNPSSLNKGDPVEIQTKSGIAQGNIHKVLDDGYLVGFRDGQLIKYPKETVSLQTEENPCGKKANIESITCPYCGSKETVYHQYVDGGTFYCQECGKWIDQEDITISKKKETFKKKSEPVSNPLEIKGKIYTVKKVIDTRKYKEDSFPPPNVERVNKEHFVLDRLSGILYDEGFEKIGVAHLHGKTLYFGEEDDFRCKVCKEE